MGIALQQTLGIGQDFNFDHDSLPKEGEEPSVHRLRARLVKSVIYRYQRIQRRADKKGKPVSKKQKRKIKRWKEEIRTLIPTDYTIMPEGKTLDTQMLKESDAMKLRRQKLNRQMKRMESQSMVDGDESSVIEVNITSSGNDDNTNVVCLQQQ